MQIDEIFAILLNKIKNLKGDNDAGYITKDNIPTYDETLTILNEEGGLNDR